ncbi:MAG: phosphorylcholine metabolism protein LicD and glycosyltransferase family 92 domain containing protein [Terrestrivirus sp.]|uniref:Phosphorylcholine metabolism protein LicD and glycosyltransferase family 92 domain containing protein n=1 Tax=Terrestrivirus sp. TaxID=2487775 RepID=A0A3G4ZQT4_9VIRU|nr:MAG: phosphorylcholine metabolism protein LicD and glycosyltransferase family 92 domain containing protein [Terrestrivirus sp.]
MNNVLIFIITIILIVLIIFGIIEYSLNNTNNESFTQAPIYNLCIMGIFKDEQDYLEEWLTYHINQGISHIYLYSNDEKMENYKFLEKYKDYITLIPWINKKNIMSDTIQRQAYKHCVDNYNNEYQFIMMLDIDEFLVPINKNKVIDVINSVDKNNTKAMKIQRYNFNANGHITRPNGKVMDNYTKHEDICSSYKTIANSKYIDTTKKFYGVHDFPFTDKKGKVYNNYFNYSNNHGNPHGCSKDDKNEIPLIINHYYTKSREEYLKRCNLWKNGGINPVGYRKDCDKLFESLQF